MGLRSHRGRVCCLLLTLATLQPAAQAAPLQASDLHGDWCLTETVLAGEREVMNASFHFGDDGRFRFVIHGSRFSGRYTLEEDTVRAEHVTLEQVRMRSDGFSARFNGESTFVRGACPPPALDFKAHMALIKAIRLQQLDSVRQLIGQAGNPDVTESSDIWAHTPLHTAAKYDAADAATLLLSLGARRDAADSAGKTPLDIAINKQALAVARVLLEAGADPNRGDEQGRTPLMFAIGHDNPALVALLLAHGANPEARFRTLEGDTVSLRAYAAQRGVRAEIRQRLDPH